MSRVKLAKAERWRSLQDLLAAMREHADSVWAEHPSSSSSRTPRAPSGFLKRIRSRKNLQENSSTSRPLDSFYQFIQSIHEKFGDKEKYERYYEWEERNNVVPAQRLETKLNEIDCLLEGLAKPETGQDVRETMSRDIWKKIVSLNRIPALRSRSPWMHLFQSQFRSDLDENIVGPSCKQ